MMRVEQRTRVLMENEKVQQELFRRAEQSEEKLRSQREAPRREIQERLNNYKRYIRDYGFNEMTRHIQYVSAPGWVEDHAHH